MIAALTAQRVFGAGGQVPPFRWNHTVDDLPVWQVTSDQMSSAPILLLTGGVKMYGQAGQAPPARYGLSYFDDPPTWYPASESLNSSVLQLLTGGGKFYGQAGQVPPSRWNYNHDDPPMWIGRPAGSAALPLLTFTTFYGAGGQVPPARFDFNYFDDPPMWVGRPTGSAVIPLLTVQVIYGQGGQVPPFRWNWGLDDSAVWQGAPVGSLVNLQFSTKPFVPARWNQHHDDPPPWTFPYKQLLTLYNPPVTNPFSNRKTAWYSEDAYWVGRPVSSTVIPLLTAQRIYGVGGQAPPARFDFNYFDDPPMWQGTPAQWNRLLAQTFTEPFPQPGRLTWWYAEDTHWTGTPTASAVIPLLTAQRFYSAGGQVPPARFSIEYHDEAAHWRGAPVGANLELFIPSPPPTPFVNRRTFWYSEDAYWVGRPLTAYGLYVPFSPPVNVAYAVTYVKTMKARTRVK